MSRRRPTRWLALTAGVSCIFAAAAVSAERLEDPTRPPPGLLAATATTLHADQPLRVQSVWLTDGRPTAVVGGRRVVRGDRLAGGRVTEIDLGGVRVRRPDGDLLLTLAGSDIKRPAQERTEP